MKSLGNSSFKSENPCNSLAVDLPEGWARCRLGDIGDWTTGGTPSRKNSSYFGGNIPWVKSGDLTDGVVEETEERLTREGLEHSAAELLPAGTLSVALYGATIGKLAILGIEAATNQACANCSCNEAIVDRWFVFYFLLSQRQALIELGQGGAQPNLTNRIIREWSLLLPPVAEQKRIVAKVEELLARVNAARERLAHVSAILKRFRRSVLAAACSGQMTADWREGKADLEPASKLLELIRSERQRSVVSPKRSGGPVDSTRAGFLGGRNGEGDADAGLPSEWTLVALSEVLHYTRSAGYGVLQPGPDVKLGVPMVRVCDLSDGTVLAGQMKRISPRIHAQYRRTQLEGDEVLVTLVGTIGRTAVVPKSIAGANVARAVAMLPLCPHVLPRYVHFVLAQPAKNAELYDLAREVARKTLNLGLLKEVMIPLAPFDEQQEIVRRVEQLFELSNAIETRAARATARVERLTQTVLARAFRGELVPTEAELARAEGRPYEPASALLARIRAARFP